MVVHIVHLFIAVTEKNELDCRYPVESVAMSKDMVTVMNFGMRLTQHHFAIHQFEVAYFSTRGSSSNKLQN